MAYTIIYNSFGSGGSGNKGWSHIKISNYRSTPLFEGDNQTHWTTEHSISGTALLKVSEGIYHSIQEARDALSKVGRNLVIKNGTDTIASVGNNDFDTTDGLALPYANSSTGAEYTFDGKTDAVGYPKCEFEINEFYGSENAMVGFTFTWVESRNDGDTSEDISYSVLSHVWKQSFSLNDSGLQTWKVDGTLRVRPYSPAGVSGSADLGRNPDSYRNLVMPSIPSNFRIKSMEWATNVEGDTLLYTLVFQEHARRLPSPASRGTGSFSFRKVLDSGAGLLGLKTFEAELEGGINAKTTDLLSSLLDASSKRINWVDGLNGKKDLITSMQIRETDIFSKKRIGLRVTAKGIDNNVESVLRGGQLTDINFGILGDFVSDTNVAPSGSEWGHALICSFKRQMFIPYASYDGTNFPKAQLMTLVGSPYEGLDSITGGINNQGSVTEELHTVEEIDLGDDIVDEKPPDLLGEEFGEDAQSPESALNSYINVKGVERLSVINNIAVTSTNSAFPQHIPITTSPPDMFIRSEYTLTRTNDPPPMLQFAVPMRCVVVDEETAVTAGDIDANGHRMYTRTINRTVRVLWGVGAGHTEETISHTFYVGDTSLTLFYPVPFDTNISRPFDPRTDSEFQITNSTVFNPEADMGGVYNVDFSVPIGTT